MGRGRETFFVLIAALAIAGCRKQPKGAGAAADPNAEQAPELSMSGLRVQDFRGPRMDWEMRADEGAGYTMKNTMLVRNMEVTLFEGGQRSTDIRADRAYMNNAGSGAPARAESILPGAPPLMPGDMYLEGNVVAISTEGNKMYTDWAHYHKSTDLITSTAPVRIERRDSITRGVGMEASADLTNIRIFNQTVTIREEDRRP